MERKDKIISFVKGLILAISLRLVMIPNKALAIEDNTSNNIPVCIEDKRHINQTDDLQVNKAVEAEKQKEDTNISKKEEQMALAQNFFYDEVNSIPIEEIISESNEYVLKDIRKDFRRRILSPDQIMREASRRSRCEKQLIFIRETNKVNKSTFKTLNKALNDTTATLVKRDQTVLKQQGEIKAKDQTILKQQDSIKIKDQIISTQQETIETQNKLINRQLGINYSNLKQGGKDFLTNKQLETEGHNINIDGQEKINTAWIEKIKVEDLDPIQRAYLNYPSKEEEIYLVNGEWLRNERKSFPRPLKGQAFTGPIDGKIRIRYDLQISSETDASEGSYQTTTQVETSPEFLRDRSNPPSGFTRIKRSIKKFINGN